MVLITQELQSSRPNSSSNFKNHKYLKTPNGPPRLSPALEQWVLGRDGFQCRAPGCGQVEGLAVYEVEIHQIAGHQNPANLVTVCSVCQPMWDLMGRGPFHQEKQEVAVGF